MTAIATAVSPANNFQVTRTSAATVIDWLLVPHWARYAYIHLHPTTMTTNIIISFLAVDPVSLDDGNVIKIAEHAAITTITGTGQEYVFQIGPGITGIADDVASSATVDSYISLNAVLPPILGISQANTGSNVYNLTCIFRS